MTFRKTLSRALLAVMLCLAALPALAQENQPPVIPSEETSAIMDERSERAAAEWDREYRRRNVYDFRIAYLVAPDALPEDHVVSERMVTELTGAEVFGDWETFAAENEAVPFQILLIHESMYEQIDLTVTQAAYRNRVIIFGMGMPLEHLVEITGNRCREEAKHATSPAYREYAYDLFITFEYVAEVSDESLRPLVDQKTLETCSRDYDQKDVSIFITTGYSSGFLSDLTMPDHFAFVIVAQTVHYKMEPNQPTENR